MAKEHLYGEQLQMFMPARELMDVHAGDSWPITTGNRGPDPDGLKFLTPMSKNNKLYNLKVWGGRERDLPESIKEKGVEEPVHVIHIKQFPHKMISNGHHRIATANSIDPNMEIPVVHHASTFWDEEQ